MVYFLAESDPDELPSSIIILVAIAMRVSKLGASKFLLLSSIPLETVFVERNNPMVFRNSTISLKPLRC